jgi:kynurenine formamidase
MRNTLRKISSRTDEYDVFFHGVTHTHFDALSRVFHDGKMYSGFPESAMKADGARALVVTNYSEGLFTRGVLVDIAWLRGVPYLDPSAVIYPADFDAWEKKTGVHIRSGDAVFVRTGRWAYRAAKGPWDIGSHAAGLSALCARWLKQRDVAVFGQRFLARCRAFRNSWRRFSGASAIDCRDGHAAF